MVNVKSSDDEASIGTVVTLFNKYLRLCCIDCKRKLL